MIDSWLIAMDNGQMVGVVPVDFKPEDQWSCKRSPDIWDSHKIKTYKSQINMAEQTLILITYNFNLPYNQIQGHRVQ